MAISVFIALLCTSVATTVIMFRSEIADTYTSDPELHKMLVDIIPVVCIDFALDTMQLTVKNVLTAMAEANDVARAGMVAVWLVQLPLSIFLGLYSTQVSGVQGFMWGSVGGSAVGFLLVAHAAYNADWEQHATAAMQRQGSNSGSK